MKKISIFFAAFAAALGFLSCSKSELTVESDGSKDFQIKAEITKTTNDGLSTKWAANDSISIFHASAGTAVYGSNDKLTIAEADLSSGIFKGSLTEELYDSNDWYAICPYSSHLSTPANVDGAYFNIGCKNSHNTAQVQTGNSSTAHLCGEYFPLWAQAKAVAKASGVALTFKNALSIVKIHVTNNTAKPLTVNSLSLTAAENIIGSFYIDFSGDAPVFTAREKYSSKEAKLTVASGAEIAVGGSADFYLGIKPFVNAAGSTLKFSVNGYEKTSTSAYEFKTGTIKTVNFNFDQEEKDYSGTYVALVENSGTSYFAMTSTDDGAGTKRFKSANVTYDGAAKFATSDASIVWNVAKVDGGYTFGNGGKYISWTSGNSAVMKDEGKVLTITPDGKYFKISFKSAETETRYLSKYSTGAYFAFYGNENQKVQFLLVPAEFDNTPIINPIEDPEKVSAKGATGVEVSYTISNPVEGRSVSATSAESWVKNFSYATAGKITFDVEANEAASERSSEITVSYEGAESVTFTVTQSAAGAVEEKTFTITSDDVVTNSGYAKYETTVDERNWIITFGGYNKSVGTNSNNRGMCNLASYSKYAVSPVTTSDVASAFACKTKLTGVKEISYTVGGGKNQTATNVYVIYSSDGETFSQISLTSGTQGAQISSGTTYKFAACDGYFGLLFKATNSSSDWRIDNVSVTFKYEVK